MQDKRERIQIEAFNKWEENYKKGTVEIATGIGKTFIGLRALHSMPKDDKIHLFLAEVTDRKKDLIDNIKKYDSIYGTNTIEDYNLQFHCYQTVRNWRNVKNIGLVIADEIHESFTPENSKFYQYNDFDAIIGLSAKIDISISYVEERGILEYTITKETYLNRHAPLIYTYTMQKAREEGLNRKVNVHLIYHKLDDTIKNIKAGSKKKSFLQTEKKAYDFWEDRLKGIIKFLFLN